MPGTRKTAPRLGGNDKKKYSVAALNDFVVREDNLFDLYLGESVAPYVALRPVTAALPVSKATMTMPLDCSRCPPNSKTGTVKHDFCAVNVPALAPGMRERWPIMESLWDANKSRNDDKPLIKNLNWLNKLTSQLAWLRDHGDRPVRIAYTTSGRPTAALIADSRAILDTSTYQVSCRDEDEAHYLLAIINSDRLFTAVEPLMPKGQFGGARTLHKHLWKLPIPAYDPGDADHVRLVALSCQATAEAGDFARNLPADTSNESVRKALRRQWQPTSETAQAIEVAVAGLLDGR